MKIIVLSIQLLLKFHQFQRNQVIFYDDKKHYFRQFRCVLRLKVKKKFENHNFRRFSGARELKKSLK